MRYPTLKKEIRNTWLTRKCSEKCEVTVQHTVWQGVCWREKNCRTGGAGAGGGGGEEVVSLRTALFHSFCPELGHFLWFLINDNWSLAKFCRYKVAQHHPYGSLFQLKLGQIPASFMFSHDSSNLYPYPPHWHNFTWDNLELQWPFGELLTRIRLFIRKVPQNKRERNPHEETVLFVKKRGYFV